jgi:hypothetical protein
MSTASNSRIVRKGVETDRAFFQILYSLSKKTLKAYLLCWRKVDMRLIGILFREFELLKIIFRDETRMERQLPQSSQHAQGTCLKLNGKFRKL